MNRKLFHICFVEMSNYSSLVHSCGRKAKYPAETACCQVKTGKILYLLKLFLFHLCQNKQGLKSLKKANVFNSISKT